MISYTWTILYTTTTDQDDRVFLQVVTFTRNVSGYGTTVGEFDTGDFANSRIGFLGFCGEDFAANSLDERFGFQSRHFVDRWSMGFACTTKVLLQSDQARLGCGKGAD